MNNQDSKLKPTKINNDEEVKLRIKRIFIGHVIFWGIWSIIIIIIGDERLAKASNTGF